MDLEKAFECVNWELYLLTYIMGLGDEWPRRMIWKCLALQLSGYWLPGVFQMLEVFGKNPYPLVFWWFPMSSDPCIVAVAESQFEIMFYSTAWWLELHPSSICWQQYPGCFCRSVAPVLLDWALGSDKINWLNITFWEMPISWISVDQKLVERSSLIGSFLFLKVKITIHWFKKMIQTMQEKDSKTCKGSPPKGLPRW